MNYKTEFYSVILGSNTFINTPCAIGMQLDDGSIEPVISAKVRESDNLLLLSFDAESHSGIPIHIRNNKPVGDIPSAQYKVEHLSNDKIIANVKTGDTVLEIRNTNHHDWGTIEILGDFVFRGIPVVVKKDKLIVGNNNVLSGNSFVNTGGILLTPSGFALGFSANIPAFEEAQ